MIINVAAGGITYVPLGAADSGKTLTSSYTATGANGKISSAVQATYVMTN
jgi:hypothetical protein